MGLLKGPASFVEFGIVDGANPTPTESDFISERIKTLAFQDIDDTYDEYSVGWVSVIDMFDSKFLQGNEAMGNFVFVSMRVDERKVPAAVLNKFVAKEEARIRVERQIPRLSRGMKIEIKERIKAELTTKAKPVPTVTDVFWSTSTGTIYFFSTNKKMQAIFEDKFRKTFGLLISQKVPSTIAESFIPDVAQFQIDALSACTFI
jgi:DNA recombination-dependent growth factor C